MQTQKKILIKNFKKNDQGNIKLNVHGFPCIQPVIHPVIPPQIQHQLTGSHVGQGKHTPGC